MTWIVVRTLQRHTLLEGGDVVYAASLPRGAALKLKFKLNLNLNLKLIVKHPPTHLPGGGVSTVRELVQVVHVDRWIRRCAVPHPHTHPTHAHGVS